MSIDPLDYVVPDDATIEDVDLAEEVVNKRDGSRLTDAEAERIVDRVTGRGRPSLSKEGKRGGTSPQIGVRLPHELDARLRAKAEREHKRPSEIVREALEHYV